MCTIYVSFSSQIGILKELFGDSKAWYEVIGAQVELIKRLEGLPLTQQAIIGIEHDDTDRYIRRN